MSEEIKEYPFEKTFDVKFNENALKNFNDLIKAKGIRHFKLESDLYGILDVVLYEEYQILQQKVEQLEKENKILKENAEHNDKVVDKVNWENMLLKTTINESITLIKQLKRSASYQRCMYELDYLLDELSKKGAKK